MAVAVGIAVAVGVALALASRRRRRCGEPHGSDGHDGVRATMGRDDASEGAPCEY
ncbi:putative membrane protein YdfJ with MMPL/SSD domain [Curtobacterium pusillum]|uniref:Membrane protein YdfJ with MMPL/SSD domain n=1 Tax=Curtobacterium pusillum TaxID=69373 RepID=A0AAW3T6P9_9MICO|nr:putative membrane protein YdfJ with MMPL/SSD domain [Curtobacterium pusillum]